MYPTKPQMGMPGQQQYDPYGPYHHPSTGIPAAVPPPPPPLPMTMGHFAADGSVPPQLTPAPWTSGLCDCTDDCGNCCVTCWCPCVTFGQIAEIVDRGSSSCALSGAFYFLINYLTGCGCLYSCFYRAKLRSQYALHESPCADCLVHCFCEQCALCQEYRELKNRGFDMALGWQGNLEKHAQLASTTAPSAVGSMMR